MRRILHLALHDTRLFVLAKDSLFFMFIMPVLFMLFFSVVLRGGGNESVQVSLQVVNEDTGFLSEAFIQQLRSENFDVDELSRAQADTTGYIRRLVLPADFTARVMAGEQAELGFTKKADSNVEYDAASDVRLRQAQAAFLGALIRWGSAGTDSSGHHTVIDSAAQQRLAAVIAEPRIVTVAQSQAGTGRPVPSGAGQSVPGMIAMFVVMIVLIGGGESLTREKQQGTLARLATTTFSRGEILMGKLLHLGLVGVIQAMVLMVAGELIGRFHLFGIDFTWGPQYWVVVLLTIPYAFSVACLTLFIGGLFRTTQQAESLGWLVGMIFAAMGGCWWPLEIMPRAAQIVGSFFPTYWAMQGLHGVVTFGRSLDAILLPAIVLLGYGLLFGWLGTRTMRVVR